MVFGTLPVFSEFTLRQMIMIKIKQNNAQFSNKLTFDCEGKPNELKPTLNCICSTV